MSLRLSVRCAALRLGLALVVLSAGTARAQAPETNTAFQALGSNADAYCSRVALIRSATKRIDIQTYILTPDITGTGMIRELESAADRGVGVRLLLDDYGSHDAKARLDRLRRTPGVEIRYINASRKQGLGRRIDYVLDFRRLNRRMHNKSFIVDDRVAIVGGRNIGDVYFRQGEAVFADLDVIVEGGALSDLRQVFETYWTSALSEPLDAIAPLPARPRTAQDPSPDRVPSCATLAPAAPRELQVVPAVVFSDPPSKLSRVQPETPESDPIREQIRREIDNPAQSLFIVSPYFIPSDGWVHDLWP